TICQQCRRKKWCTGPCTWNSKCEECTRRSRCKDCRKKEYCDDCTQGGSAKRARSFPAHALQKVSFLIYSRFSGLIIICDQIVVLEGFSPSRRTSRSRKEKCRKQLKERATWWHSIQNSIAKSIE